MATRTPPPQSPPPSPPSSTSESPPTSTPIKTSPVCQAQSFCIDALLRPTGATSPLSPPRDGSGSSPPSSPASSSPFGHRPTLISPSAAATGIFPTNPATGGSLYPYPGALLTATAASAAPPTSSVASSVTSSLENVLKNGMNMQTVQLEWLARTGMLYHRFPELAGNLSFVKL